MHFTHISAKIKLKNLKQHFDLVDPGPYSSLATPLMLFNHNVFLNKFFFHNTHLIYKLACILLPQRAAS